MPCINHEIKQHCCLSFWRYDWLSEAIQIGEYRVSDGPIQMTINFWCRDKGPCIYRWYWFLWRSLGSSVMLPQVGVRKVETLSCSNLVSDISVSCYSKFDKDGIVDEANMKRMSIMVTFLHMISTFSADECGDGGNARGSPWYSWRYADTRRKYTSDCSAGFGNIKVSELLRGGNWYTQTWFCSGVVFWMNTE